MAENNFSKQMANREVCDLIFEEYSTKKPFLFCDYANTSSVELTGEGKRRRLRYFYFNTYECFRGCRKRNRGMVV